MFFWGGLHESDWGGGGETLSCINYVWTLYHITGKYICPLSLSEFTQMIVLFSIILTDVQFLEHNQLNT